jgi:hypothetical protein
MEVPSPAPAQAINLELCILCLESFVHDEKEEFIRRVCNHPLEKHYCCTDCRKTYEDKHLKRCASERYIFSKKYADLYPNAMYMTTPCPCEECGYSYYSKRDGSHGMWAQGTGKTPHNCAYLIGTGTESHRCQYFDQMGCSQYITTLKSFEMASFKEGRLNGKYIIIQLYMCDLSSKDALTVSQIHPSGRCAYLPTATVSVLEFKAGVLQTVNEYLSLKFGGIYEYIGTLSQSQSLSIENIYKELLGGEKMAQHGFVHMTEYRYDTNILVYEKRNMLAYNQLPLYKYGTMDHPDVLSDRERSIGTPLLDVANGYYVIKKMETVMKPYITKQIKKRYVTKIPDPNPDPIEDPYKKRCIKIRETPYRVAPTSDNAFQYLEKRVDEYGLLHYGKIGTKIKSYLGRRSEYINKPVNETKCHYDVRRITIYRQNGSMHDQRETKYVNGGVAPLLDGPCVYYHDNGQIKAEFHYVGGKREGHYFAYDCDGKLRQCGFYTNNKLELLFQC